MQAITAGAWAAMMAGRYRPNPATDPRAALRPWLAEIVLRLFGKHRQRAHVRSREMLCDAHLDLEISVPVTLHVPAPDGRYAAQEILEALVAIPLDQRIALVLHHLKGWTFADVAGSSASPPGPRQPASARASGTSSAPSSVGATRGPDSLLTTMPRPL